MQFDQIKLKISQILSQFAHAGKKRRGTCNALSQRYKMKISLERVD